MNRKNLALFLTLAVALGALAAALAWRLNRPVALVNGQAITSEDLARELRMRFGAEVLQDLVGERLIEQAARQYGVDLPPGELSQWVADFRERPEARAMLDSGRLTEERLRRNLGTAVPLYYLSLKDTPEEDRKQYFRTHRSNFEELHLRHILLGSRDEGVELKARIRGADDFATLATVHSLDGNTRQEGGALGRVTRAELEGSFDQADVDQLFALQKGQVSEPLRAGTGGWHLFLVEGRKVDYQSLRLRVVEEMARERVAGYLEALRARAKVEFLLPPEEGGPAGPSPASAPGPGAAPAAQAPSGPAGAQASPDGQAPDGALAPPDGQAPGAPQAGEVP